MTYWEELNKYEAPSSEYELIPHGTLAKVRMTIKPGNYNEPVKGWTDGYATKSDTKGTVYLEAEFIVLEGKYAKRKVWSRIGLHSPKGPDWENMGKGFIKSMINSARGLSAKDNSDTANLVRSINSFASIDGIEFAARIDVIAEKSDEHVKYRNEIKAAITVDHKDYAMIMGKIGSQAHQPNAQQSINSSNRQSWA